MAKENLTLVIFTMEVNDTNYEYGIPIKQVHEITRPGNAIKLPGMPDFVDGIMNLRGSVIPVIDCKKRFGLGITKKKDTTRNVVVNIDKLKYGVIVDDVVEIVNIPADHIEDAPNIAGGINSKFIIGIGKIDERLIIALDASRILNKNEEESLENTF
jgi:purine-binding chemotaxis protein CheW